MDFRLIKMMGLITYICLWTTAFLGLGLWKLRIRAVRPWMHYLMAAVTLASATTHVILIQLAD